MAESSWNAPRCKGSQQTIDPAAAIHESLPRSTVMACQGLKGRRGRLAIFQNTSVFHSAPCLGSFTRSYGNLIGLSAACEGKRAPPAQALLVLGHESLGRGPFDRTAGAVSVVLARESGT